jgi:hypothetical protein
VKSLIAAKFFLALALVCSSLFAKDMVLTTLDGQKIVLHEDNTWTFQSGKRAEIEQDFTVPVNGGKIVLIATDGTWGFVEKEIVHQEEEVKADSVVGNGHSVNKDVMAANAEAQKLALAQATAKIKVALGKLKIDGTKLSDCIKRAEKDVTKKEDFKQGTGWDVSVRVFLDRGSILAVADCAMKKDDEAADSTKKASGSKKKSGKKAAAGAQ